MRLLFLVSRYANDSRAAGGDVQGSLYARYLAEAGHQVTYLTSTYPGGPARELRDGVEVIRLGRPETLAWRMWGYYQHHGGEFDAVYAEAFGGARVPFLAPLYVRQPLLAAWYQLNRPLFDQQYGRTAGFLLGGFERWVARLHRRATILTPSEARRADLIDFGFRAEQVVALPPLGIDLADFAPPPAAGREPLVVWLGKLRRYKCVDHLVAAMAQVQAAHPAARLVIAGRRDEDSYVKELRRQAADLGIADNVEFACDLSEQAKTDLLRRATVLALPSPIEGFGIVLLEAACQGTPAVVSQGVPEEVVRHGYNGLRVPFGDSKRLAEALLRVLTSPELHAELAENAVAHARTFSRERLTTRLQETLLGAVRPATDFAAVPETHKRIA
ncbi:MAG TPA: glycosyltransferase family 4 protein [Dehalococcoidia bacterium]|nr:glycosyltransferase family 4 protein [Dehalococcoidia bacterium]